jgi:hypothetical protein
VVFSAALGAELGADLRVDRRQPAGGQATGFEDGAQQVDGTGLAVGAGHADDGHELRWVAKEGG